MCEIKRDIYGFIQEDIMNDMRRSLPIKMKELDTYGNPNYITVRNEKELEDYLFSTFGTGTLVGYEPITINE